MSVALYLPVSSCAFLPSKPELGSSPHQCGKAQEGKDCCRSADDAHCPQHTLGRSVDKAHDDGAGHHRGC